MTIDPFEVTSIRSLNSAPFLSALLDLNNAYRTELSLLDAEDLQHLLGRAYFAARIGLVQAFLISLDQDAHYDGVNFLWFRERYDRFVYIDRVVVAPEARGRGVARALYKSLIDHARRDGHTRIVCEVNSAPPNPGSDAFHASVGFKAVGEAKIHSGAKTVRYLSLSLRTAE